MSLCGLPLPVRGNDRLGDLEMSLSAMQYDAAKISKFAPPSFFRIRDHSCTTSEMGIALCTKLQGALLNEGNKS